MKKSCVVVLSLILVMSLLHGAAKADTVVKTTLIEDDFRVGIFLYFVEGVPVDSMGIISTVVQEAVASYSSSAQMAKPQTITTSSAIEAELLSLFQSPLPNNWDAYVAALSYPDTNRWDSIYKTDLFVDAGSEGMATTLVGSGFQYILSLEVKEQLAKDISQSLNEFLD